jgi:phosphoribosylformylglycinamidine synthase
VVLRYADAQGRRAGGAFPANPNGSLDDIAGICDPTGRIFGLMPHPEGYHHWTHHPDWPRIKDQCRRSGTPLPEGATPGLEIFRSAVAYLQAA